VSVGVVVVGEMVRGRGKERKERGRRKINKQTNKQTTQEKKKRCCSQAIHHFNQGVTGVSMG
jgi:hypothetical protein